MLAVETETSPGAPARACAADPAVRSSPLVEAVGVLRWVRCGRGEVADGDAPDDAASLLILTYHECRENVWRIRKPNLYESPLAVE